MKRTCLCLAVTVSAAVLFATNAFAVTITGSGGNGWQSPWTADNSAPPYWDNASYEIGSGSHDNNIGYYMTKTGGQVTGAGNGNGQSGGNHGPGVGYPYWGASSGAADLSMFFSGASSVTVTFKDAYSNQDGNHAGVPADSFGWFTTDASGSSRGANNVLLSATAHTAGNSATFAPGEYFGFYLDNTDRGTFNTLEGFDLAPNYPGGFAHFQHFTVFQQDANTLWIGVEDLLTSLNGGVGGAGDQDYNDFIVEITSTPSVPPASVPDGGSTLLLLGASLMALMGVTRMKVNSLLKK
jgi:hypothetical protein